MHALLHQLEPLHHTEAVLLVDDHQAQLLELDILLEQRVRADHHLHQPFRDQLLDLRLFPCRYSIPSAAPARSRSCSAAA